ncbi:hypothetical protein LCGC14_2048330, partial [marine sediment metagenome]
STYDYVPVRISVTDLAGRTLISAAGDPDTGADEDLTNDWSKSWTEGTTWIDDAFGGTLTSRTDSIYDDDDFDGTTEDNDNGRVTEVRRYHAIPTGTGTLGLNYHLTAYKYDSDTGRRTHAIVVVSGTATDNSMELVTETLYDQLGRVTQTNQGVSDTDSDMSTDYDSYPTLQRISKSLFDEWDNTTDRNPEPGSGNEGVGDGRVTGRYRYDGSGDNDAVRTDYHHDYRGRLRGTARAGHNGTAWATTGPYPVHDYDGQGRQIAVASYDDEPDWTGTVVDDVDYAAAEGTDRVTLSKTNYDPKGQVWSTERHEINISSGADDGAMTTDHWYDAAGRQIKSKSPAGLFSKTLYDSAGRVAATAGCFDDDETTYGVAGNLAGDTVVGLDFTEHDKAGRAVKVYKGTALGSTWTGTNPDPNSGSGGNMVAVAKQWYDADHNGTGSDSRPYLTGSSRIVAGYTGTTPGTGDHYVLTKFEYDSAGMQSKMTEPAGTGTTGSGNYTTTTYDALGRQAIASTYDSSDTTLGKVEHAYGTTPRRTSTKVHKENSSQYRITLYDYDAQGRLRQQTGTGYGLTKWMYDDYGRLTGTYRGWLLDPTSDPYTVNSDDSVHEQTIPFYDDVGRVWMTQHFQRHDDATGTGVLDLPGGDDPTARVTYTVNWFDDVGRTEKVAYYGDNDDTDIPNKSYDFDGGGNDYDDAELVTGTGTYVLTQYAY